MGEAPKPPASGALFAVLLCAVLAGGVWVMRVRNANQAEAAGANTAAVFDADRSRRGISDWDESHTAASLWSKVAKLRAKAVRWLDPGRPAAATPPEEAISESAAPAASPRRPRAEAPPLPDFGGMPADQKAAELWQGGVLAMRQGDNRWAVPMFEECLRLRPAQQECRTALAEA